MIFDKEVKVIQWRRHNLFNKWCWTNWTSTYKKKKMNLNIDLMPITKSNSKMIIDLNVKCKTRILPEDSIREKLVDLEVTMTFRYNTKHNP